MKRKLTEEHVTKVTPALLRAANVPLRFWDASWNAITDEATRNKFGPLLANVHETVNAGDGFLIGGLLGTGKTAMAVLFAKEVIRRGGVVTFIPVFDFMDYIIKDVRVSGEEETIIERLSRSHMLIFDDLGTETFGKSQVGMTMLERVIRQAYNNKVSMIVTTNLVEDEIKDRYSPSVISLLKRTMSPKSLNSDQWSKSDGH